MDRRRLLLAASALLSAPLLHAQQRVYRVGWLSAGAKKRPQKTQFRTIFDAEMRRLGFIEDRDYVIDYIGVEGQFERVDAAWRELQRRKPDVIVASADRIARRIKPLVKSIPVVFISFDPVREGYVESIARPGGNFTGFSLSSGPELEAKRLEILKEMMPSLRRIAFLGAPFDWEHPFSGVAVRAAARSLGLEISLIECGETDVTAGLERLAKTRPDAVLIPSSVVMYQFRTQIGEFLGSHRIPGAFWYEDSVVAGGLMSYGADWDDTTRKIAGFIVRIVKGGDPATMPVEQPSVFRLVLNLQAARQLGIAVPQSVLLRADRVIE